MFSALIEGLAGPGYAVTQDLFDANVLRGLRDEAVRAESEGLLVEASIGRGGDRQRRASVRGDRTLWIDPASTHPPEVAWLAAMENLRYDLNRELALGLFSLETHYAAYAPGAFYARHSDRHARTATRVVSTVLYLNEEWDDADGGALRLFVGRGDGEVPLDVMPRFGCFVAFLSDRFEHEVLPARRERWSVTGWLRRRD